MKIGLLGHGVVGSGVRNIIDAQKTDHLNDVCVTKILVKDESEVTDERMTLDVNDILEDSSIDLVCECMGGLEPAHTFALQALQNGKHVVTSNKKMLATFSKELFATAAQNNVYLGYEASVGGGIPWIHEIYRTRRIDEIDHFEGIFNGTTNYILSQMSSEGKEFDEMLANAQALGYAERNPSDDIDGFDVRYKTALSSFAGFDCLVDPKEIITYGIRTILAKDITYAKEHGYCVKLIGKGSMHDGELNCSVLPTMVKKDSFFANIPLNYNAVSTDSKTLGKAMYVGQGAGSLPTAHAVVQDIIDIHAKQNLRIARPVEVECKHDLTKRVFYIRTNQVYAYASFVDENIDENTILTKPVTLHEIHTCIQEAHDETVFIAEVEK